MRSVSQGKRTDPIKGLRHVIGVTNRIEIGAAAYGSMPRTAAQIHSMAQRLRQVRPGHCAGRSRDDHVRDSVMSAVLLNGSLAGSQAQRQLRIGGPRLQPHAVTTSKLSLERHL